MEFSRLQFLLRPEDGPYEPTVGLIEKKNEFLKRSVGTDCGINKIHFCNLYVKGHVFYYNKLYGFLILWERNVSGGILLL
jgi:hypothetical protein